MKTLIVERVGSINHGNCYNSYQYVVKSLNRELSVEAIAALRNMGVLGFGQSYEVRKRDDEPVDVCNRYKVICVSDYVDSSD